MTPTMINTSELGNTLNNDKIAFLVGRPQPYFTWKTIIEPFSVVLWSLLAVSVTIGAISLALLLYVSLNRSLRYSITRAMCFTLRSLVGQATKLPNDEPIRIFTASWWI